MFNIKDFGKSLLIPSLIVSGVFVFSFGISYLSTISSGEYLQSMPYYTKSTIADNKVSQYLGTDGVTALNGIITKVKNNALARSRSGNSQVEKNSLYNAYLDNYLAKIDTLDNKVRTAVGNDDYAFLFQYIYPRVVELKASNTNQIAEIMSELNVADESNTTTNTTSAGNNTSTNGTTGTSTSTNTTTTTTTTPNDARTNVKNYMQANMSDIDVILSAMIVAKVDPTMVASVAVELGYANITEQMIADHTNANLATYMADATGKLAAKGVKPTQAQVDAFKAAFGKGNKVVATSSERNGGGGDGQTSITHNASYPSLSKSIVTPTTSYKEVLTWATNEASMPEPEWIKSIPDYSSEKEGYSLSQQFGCMAAINAANYADKYRNYSDMSQSDIFAFIIAKAKECSGGGITYSNGIIALKEHLYPWKAKGNPSDTVTLQFSSSAWKDITPGNATRGRIWVPAGATIKIGGVTGYGPKSIIAYRWNAAPSGTEQALADMNATTNVDEFFRKRGTGDVSVSNGAGFAGLKPLATSTTRGTYGAQYNSPDAEFKNGNKTVLGINLCFDQLTCGGNVYIPSISMIAYTPEVSGWIYFEDLNFKSNSRDLIPWHTILGADKQRGSAISAIIEMPLSLAKSTLQNTEWDSNGEPK